MAGQQCKKMVIASDSNDLDHQRELSGLRYLVNILSEHFGVGLIRSLPSGRIVESNPCAARLTGYGQTEMEGRSVFDLIDPGHSRLNFGTDMMTGRVEDLCVSIRRKRGTPVRARLTAIPLRRHRRSYSLVMLEPIKASAAAAPAPEPARQAAPGTGITAIIGKSRIIRELCTTTSKAAHSDSTVLIQGESGTGKEIFAEAIHKHSRRAEHAFVRVNCVAISETLLESELFGHVKGAFTGAIRDRKGRFQQADGGTILLDEIGSMSPGGQAKLLRVVQEREFEPVGSSRTTRCNVRIIATTNVDLKKAVRRGRFRDDLYYRLSVLPLQLPPLRRRKEDIPLLARFFLQKYADRAQKTIIDFHPETLSVLLNYDWPGNVRELKNVIEHIVVITEDDYILPSILPKYLTHQMDDDAPAVSNNMSLRHRLDILERQIVLQTLCRVHWVKKSAARQLGIDPRNFNYFLRKHNLMHKPVAEKL